MFADIDPETGNITADSIAHKVNSKTKAIIVVHHGGYPCDMNDIHYVAAKAAIPVIEDAAHALGAKYKGDVMGTLSRFACFSFQAIKHVTCGDGGALCCQFKTDYERARLLRWFGIDRRNTKASILGEREFDVKECGYKYHMNNLAAAVGLGNLIDFPASLKRRQEVGKFFQKNLDGVPGITLMRDESDRIHAYWFFSMLVDRREDLIRKLAIEGVEASVVHLRIDRNSCFGGPYDLPGQAEFERRHLALPTHELMTWEAADRVVKVIQTGW